MTRAITFSMNLLGLAELRPEVKRRLLQMQLRGIFKNSPIGICLAFLACISIYAGFLVLGSLDLVYGSIWLFLHILCFVGLLYIAVGAQGISDAELDVSWRRPLYILLAGMDGLIWGLSPLFLLTNPNVQHELVLAIASVVVSSAGVVIFGYYLPLALVHFFALSLPWLFMYVRMGGYLGYTLASMSVVYMIGLSTLALLSHKVFLSAVLTSVENESLACELADQRDAAQRANATKTHFLAAASHDLRQPVQALMMLVGALEARALDADLRTLADQISRSTEAIGDLLTSLLDISRIDAGVVQVNARPFDMSGFLERVARDYDGEASSKGLELRVVPSTAQVRTDPVLLESVLRNLVSNAVRYTERGRVLVGCRRRPDGISLAVFDTGPGISSDYREKVFEEFFQIGNAERNRAKGLGLGLAIVKRLCALIGADVRLRSEPGKGTGVVVALLRDATPLRSRARQKPPAADTARSIMVIDDDAAICDAVRLMLTSWGHQTVTASSSQEALSAISARSFTPDLIICDYRLNDGENGIALLNQIMKCRQLKIPGVILTGDTAPDRLREAHESGYKILHKPLTANVLKEAIRL